MRLASEFLVPDLVRGMAAYVYGKDSEHFAIQYLSVVVVVAVPQLVCPSKPAPLRKNKQLARECHRSSGLLMLCCALMCVSAGQ